MLGRSCDRVELTSGLRDEERSFEIETYSPISHRLVNDEKYATYRATSGNTLIFSVQDKSWKVNIYTRLCLLKMDWKYSYYHRRIKYRVLNMIDNFHMKCCLRTDFRF